MALEVRQRSFAFGRRGQPSAVMETGDVATCMGLVVIDREQGLGFMAHYDAPWLDSSLEAALEELSKRVSDPARVEVYDIMGLERIQLLMWTALSSVFVLWIMWWFTLTGVFSWALAAMITVLIPAIGLLTRWRVRQALRKLGFPPPRVLKKSNICRGSGPWWGRVLSAIVRWARVDTRINVAVDLNTVEPPMVSFPPKWHREDRFQPLPMAARTALKVGRWTMHRHSDSA